MSAPRRFVAWQPVLTDHQAFTLEELARQSASTLVAYVLRAEDAVRRTQGWTPTQVVSIEQRVVPGAGALRHCIGRLREHRADTHLFCSPFESPILILALLWASAMGLDFYLISEPYSPRTEGYLEDGGKLKGRLKGWLRPLVYRVYAWLIKGRVGGVFAISSLAVEQYRRAGVSARQLFPFGYFVPSSDRAPRQRVGDRSPHGIRMAFVGSLIRRKGIDLLVSAVQTMRAEGLAVELDIFGPGDPSRLALGDPARYRGTIPFGTVQSVLAPYDLLVVPSRFDGWGVVVNEALLAGVPVACSEGVGARALVETFAAGAVFPCDDAAAMAVVLKELLDPERLAALRGSAGHVAPRLQPSVAAAYMLDVMRAEPSRRAAIRSPWYADSGQAHG